MRVLLSGASGLIGTALTKSLRAQGHDVRALVRTPAAPAGAYTWDPKAGTVDARAFEGVDAVVHLAGENVGAARWNDAVKARIEQSRVDGTRTLVRAVLAQPEGARPKVFVSASAVGFYGDAHGQTVDERSPRGQGFLADVSAAWEAELAPLEGTAVRVAVMRFGVVLAREGGALEKMRLPFKLGLGGPIGDGRAYFPWVHIADVVGAITFALERTDASGPYNVVGPEAATNAAFTEALAKAVHRPAFFRVPKLALRLAAGEEMAREMFFASARVVPKRLEEAGYAFRFPRLEGALQDLVG